MHEQHVRSMPNAAPAPELYVVDVRMPSRDTLI